MTAWVNPGLLIHPTLWALFVSYMVKSALAVVYLPIFTIIYSPSNRLLAKNICKKLLINKVLI